MNAQQLWQRHREYLSGVPEVGLTLDVSRIEFDVAWLESMRAASERALQAMRELEAGAIANPDEKRMVGHYWLRAPQLAPSPEISREIASTVDRIEAFAAEIHQAGQFTEVLSIGIGGSALGPMFVADALGSPRTDRMRIHFVDNTDPDGIERVLAALDGKLDRTLTLVTSKSGGTPETYNGMKLTGAAYERAGLALARHAVAITMPGSKLDALAMADGWLERFPMFDWIGGRTSELSAVGLLPAALQGLDIRALLAGAAACDEATRNTDLLRNPAMMLALMWHKATGGRGLKDMVVLPYKDRLLLFSRYLQQLVMESLGKRLDLAGKVVEQGIAVYGNKGSTDQHAYVQQLRDGINNFFVLFVRVLESGGDAIEVEPGVTAGDYLNGLLLGTREALAENGRQSLLLTVPKVDARVVGALIALFERAVGFYASLIGINAYHQPGVEAGKKAAASILALQRQVAGALSAEPRTVAELAAAAAAAEREETVYLLLQHLAANGGARLDSDGRFSKA